MIPGRNGIIRRALQVIGLALAVLSAVWFIVLLVFGGFDASVLGVTLTTHEPLRPLVIAGIGALVFVLAGGDARLSLLSNLPGGAATIRASRLIRQSRSAPPAVAFALSVAVCVFGYVYGSKVAGGSDSWGYLSQAELWLAGDLHVDQAFVKDLPWPEGREMFAPLAYRVGAGEASRTIVPVYSAGLPMLLAGAKAIAGEANKFWVVPLFAGVLVLATYGIGRRMVSPAVGLAGAWLVATSPVVLSFAVVTLSDIPTAAAWAAAFWFLLGSSRPSALASGLSAGLAVLIRPNLVPLVPVLGLIYVRRLFSPATRPTAFIDATLFSIGVVPGVAATAWVNAWLYGSPFASGYGNLAGYFSRSYFVPNVRNYVGWLAEMQTPVALLGLAAVFVPARTLWPGAKERTIVASAALFVLLLWVIYFFYNVFDAWWYLRFLLPSWPFIMVGMVAALRAGAASRPAFVRAGLAMGVVLLGFYELRLAARVDAFDLWIGERRYIRAGQMTGQLTLPNSVILAMQHSGSVRYYGGRMTLRYDAIDRSRIDDVVTWFTSHGAHVYLVAEDWEMTDIRGRFSGTRAGDALERPPLAIYQEPGTLFLYDLSQPRQEGQAPTFVTGVDRGLVVPGPAPPPTLSLRP